MLNELREELTELAKRLNRKHGPVVIVEDDQDDQLMLWREAKFLFPEADIKTLGNGAELMDYLRDEKRQAGTNFDKRKPRLILLDLHMPKMDGFKTLERLRRTAGMNDIPVVIISGTDKAGEINEAKQRGAEAFLSKPFSRDQWVFF